MFVFRNRFSFSSYNINRLRKSLDLRKAICFRIYKSLMWFIIIELLNINKTKRRNKMACGCNNRYSGGAVQSANINNRASFCDAGCGCNGSGTVLGTSTGSCGCNHGSVGGTSTGTCGCNNGSVGGANTNTCGCNHNSVCGTNTGNSCGCGNGSVNGANTGNSCGCGNGTTCGTNTCSRCGSNNSRCGKSKNCCGLINGVSCGVTQAAFGIARGVDTILGSVFGCC